MLVNKPTDQRRLTDAEQNVLRMIVGGMSDKEIGFALDVDERAVAVLFADMFAKIGASDRASAAAVAIKQGFVQVDL